MSSLSLSSSSSDPLPQEWFARDAMEVAPDLLGKRLVIGACSGRILEVEAYTSDDPASHTFRGRTPRNSAMFGPAGRLYVYFTYGMHHCANIVTGCVDDGQGVLIRAIEPVEGIDLMRVRRGLRRDADLCNGPGKLAQALGIDLAMNGTPVELHDDGLAVELPEPGPRIGISRAVEWPRRWRLLTASTRAPAPAPAARSIAAVPKLSDPSASRSRVDGRPPVA